MQKFYILVNDELRKKHLKLAKQMVDAKSLHLGK